MSDWVVNESNGIVQLQERPAQQAAIARRRRSIPPSRLIKLAEIAARKISARTCSSTWAEDCLLRGAVYAPDFRCQCANCREKFPMRRHPRPYRESDYSEDCQVESDTDPELEEELAKLRDRRERIGSVFLMADGSSHLRGSES